MYIFGCGSVFGVTARVDMLLCVASWLWSPWLPRMQSSAACVPQTVIQTREGRGGERERGGGEG